MRLKTEHLTLFAGAFCQVAAVAANTRIIALGSAGAAFWTGGLVSWIWFANTRRCAHAEGLLARSVYCFGAACGTVVGMWLGSLWR